jgi:hypothetical protein
MISHRCKKCLWWDRQHVSVKHIAKIDWKPTPGFCRRRRPGVVGVEKNHARCCWGRKEPCRSSTRNGR